MQRQRTISSVLDAMSKKLTRRGIFLTKIISLVIWRRLQLLILSHYSKSGSKCRWPSFDLEMVRRSYSLESSNAVKYPVGENSLHDRQESHLIAGIKLGGGRFPGEAAIPNFCPLLRKNYTNKMLFGRGDARLEDHGVLLSSCSFVDAPTISWSPSTKDMVKDPVNRHPNTNVVQALLSGTSAITDSQISDRRLLVKKRSDCAASCRVHDSRESFSSHDRERSCDFVCKVSKGRDLGVLGEKTNRNIAKVWTKAKDLARTLICQFSHLGSIYWGFNKSWAHLIALYAPGNRYVIGEKLAA